MLYFLAVFLPAGIIWLSMHADYQSFSEPHPTNYRIDNYQPTNSLSPMIEKLYVTDTSSVKPAAVELSPWWTLNATTKEFPIGYAYDGFWRGKDKEIAYLLKLDLYPSEPWPGWSIGLIGLTIFIGIEALLFFDVMLLLRCTGDEHPTSYVPINPINPPQPPTSDPPAPYAPVDPSESPTPTPFAAPTVVVELAEPSPANH